MASASFRGFCVLILFIASGGSGIARDYFTEIFNGDFDLSYSTFTFKPDPSLNGYAVCRLPATEFSTPPTNDASLLLLNPGPSGWLDLRGNLVPFYGERYRNVYVNEDGSVTLGAFSDAPFKNLSDHFRQPRVSAWFGEIGPAFNRPVYARTLSNRVAITW